MQLDFSRNVEFPNTVDVHLTENEIKILVEKRL